jgi:hypothetical protein
VLGSLGLVAFAVYGTLHDPWIFVSGMAVAAIAGCIYRFVGRQRHG